MDRILYTSILEYHSAIERKEFLTHATTWTKLENIMLNVKRTRPKKTKTV
jgi:hypothetical protein